MDAAELITGMSNNPSSSAITGTQASALSRRDYDEPQDCEDEDMVIPPRAPSRLALRQALQSKKEGVTSGEGPRRPQLRRSAELGRHRHSYSSYDSEAEDTPYSSSDSGDEDGHESDTSDSSVEDDFIFDAVFGAKPAQAPVISEPEAAPPPPPSPPAPVYQPSPLSPVSSHDCQPPDRPHIIPRHNYQHHGLSRSSLHYQKWFWAIRQEEWEEWEAQVEEAQAAATAYDGITVPPKPSPRGPPRDRMIVPEPPPSYSRFHAADPNASIYPRAGDLSDLPHGQSVHLDRWFCFFPLYKVHKKLFFYDMQHRAKHRFSPDPMDSPPSEDDLTLVGDSSNEVEIEEDESLDDLIQVDLGGGHTRPKPKPNPRPWETNWILRWEKFAEILRQEAFARAAVFEPATVATPVDGAGRPLAKFYFEEADEDSDGSTTDPDSDEDDYGVLMSNPIFTRPLGFGFGSISRDMHDFDTRQESTLICT
ncbi:hypothetical protein OE88DRAFT_1663223 [Heliocybe sulcata]|uniref:Uncharacterized protein n=1 Tax=Heliocybe sulcata TaxID=5364 RepID=A0A5C3MVR4_9AGAM|nr:hypothetical protein OE88DRAFT_1663223 [Heliocybe sulcata]